MSKERLDKIASQLGFFRGVKYVGSYPTRPAQPPEGDFPVIAFTGRSNSGKSTLLSALCDHRNLAKTSRTAGKTRTLNYFLVPNPFGEEHPLYLVDMPGYGYARLSKAEMKKLREIIDRFLLEENRLIVAVLVLDARRRLEREERGVLEHSLTIGRPCILARTKWDRLNAREKKDARAMWKEEGIASICIPVSSPQKIGLAEILREIKRQLS